MTGRTLLARCRSLGMTLGVGTEGSLVWEADGDPPDDILSELRECKAEVLALLIPPLAWDQIEAEHLLGELRLEVDELKANFGNRLAAPLARLLDDALLIGERYIRDHAVEAARGWDAMQLLRELLPHVRDITERWRRANKLQTPRK